MFAYPGSTSALRFYRGFHLKSLPAVAIFGFCGVQCYPFGFITQIFHLSSSEQNRGSPKTPPTHSNLKIDKGANIIQYLNNNSVLDCLDLSRNDQEQKKKKKKKRSEIHLLSPQL